MPDSRAVAVALGSYDAGVQPPPPGFPPHWGSSPNDPREHIEPGYGGQPGLGGYDQPTAAEHSQQPPYSGYGEPPPPGPGHRQADYGPSSWAGQRAPAAGPNSQQLISWVTFGVVGLLGLLGAVLTLTLWINLSSAISRASDVCNRYGGEYSTLCRQHINKVVPTMPPVLVICLFLIVAAGLAATGGAVMLVLRKQLGQFLILGGGIVMLVLSIGCEARYGATGRLTYDLIAGVVIAVAGGLMLIPAFQATLGLSPTWAGGPVSGGVQGGQWSYGQPQPPQQGPPGLGGPPPQHW
jgi:hypothetical protein